MPSSTGRARRPPPVAVLASALVTAWGAGCTSGPTGRPARAPADGDGLLARWSRGEPALPTPPSCGDDCDGAGVTEPPARTDAHRANLPSDGFPTYVPPPAPVEAYTAVPVVHGGTIEGRLRWRRSPRAPRVLPGGPGCEGPRPNPTVGRAPAALGGTVVYLADVGVGKHPAVIGGVVERRGCGFAPRVQLAAPIGATLVVSNDLGRNPWSVVIRPLDGRHGLEPLFAGSLPAGRQAEVPLVRAGFYEVAVDPADPASAGWIVVPRHPYYALVEADGRFALHDVPPGDYTLVAWHEPVVTAVDAATGRMARTPPSEARVRVRVAPEQTTIQDLYLE